MNRLKDKVAIITGAAQGMGAAHARLFVEEGAKVVVTDIVEDKGQALADELGDNAIFKKLDVTNGDNWDEVVALAKEKFGKLNILVNNAGITTNKSIADTSEEDYRKIVTLNQVSVFLGIKAASPALKEAGNGSIINISSINGLVGGAIGYTDTKFAVRGMTKAAALELSKDGVRVNSVHPGVIETPMLQQEDAKAAIKEFSKQIPIKRIAQAEEVSKLVLFLASDDSSYSTGAEFVADGGVTAQ